MTDDASLYAVMTAFIAFSHEKQSVYVNAIREKIHLNIDETLVILKKVVKFQDQFFKKLAKDLRTHKNCNHVIDIKNNEFFYDFLYYLLNTKLIALREYFDDVLTKS